MLRVSQRFQCIKFLRRLGLFCRSSCLPLLSLTRTPRGGHCEWMAACCDPFFEYCERSVWIVGMLCFFLVLFGISLVVYTFYTYMVPFLYKTESGPMFSFYFIYGHYLLINISFHYMKGVYTDPGRVPKFTSTKLTEKQVKLGWKICYKCDSPKPPRAHHCRICGRCVLKMDHHCPWMFNCVGQYNHRHFMLFVIFMWLGTAYVVLCSWTRVVVHMYMYRGYLKSIVDTIGLNGGLERAKSLPLSSQSSEGFLVVIVFFVCFGVTIALLVLGGWNVYLVTRAETAIEFYINHRDKRDYKKQGKKFLNPYNNGARRNCALFLGINQRRSFIRHVLFPSTHPPIEDGMYWQRCDGASNNNGHTTVDA